MLARARAQPPTPAPPEGFARGVENGGHVRRGRGQLQQAQQGLGQGQGWGWRVRARGGRARGLCPAHRKGPVPQRPARRWLVQPDWAARASSPQPVLPHGTPHNKHGTAKQGMGSTDIDKPHDHSRVLPRRRGQAVGAAKPKVDAVQQGGAVDQDEAGREGRGGFRWRAGGPPCTPPERPPPAPRSRPPTLPARETQPVPPTPVPKPPSKTRRTDARRQRPGLPRHAGPPPQAPAAEGVAGGWADQ